MPTQPNILLIISDDHRASAIRAHGDPTVRTPVLDQLAADGVDFRAAHIMGGLTGAVCVPSRACLHTGANVLAASVSKEVESGPGLQTLRPDLATLGETLHGAGYTTFATGKWHNDKASFARSFDGADKVFFGGMCDHDAVPLHDFDPSGLYPDSACYTGEGFSTDIFADAATRFLRGYEAERPFFLYVAFTAPHDPRTPPPEFAELYQADDIPLPPNFLAEHPFDNGEMRIRDEALAPWPRTPKVVQQHIADYYGMISHMDDRIGQILATLEETGQADNTIVVYMADHGLSVGQHGLLGKQNLYDHSIRVPLIVRGPDLPAGRNVDALAYAYDIHPTLCELAGASIPAGVDGRSLAPLLSGAQVTARQTVFSIYKDIQRSASDGRWKLIRYYRAEDRGVGEDRVQLFDLANDPWETNDLANASAHTAELERLARAMTAWQQEVGDPLAA